MAVNLDLLFGHASFCQRWKGVDGQPVLDAIAEIKELRAKVAGFEKNGTIFKVDHLHEEIAAKDAEIANLKKAIAISDMRIQESERAIRYTGVVHVDDQRKLVALESQLKDSRLKFESSEEALSETKAKVAEAKWLLSIIEKEGETK